MPLVNKALLVIECNLNRELSQAEIAKACDVSRFHLAHARYAVFAHDGHVTEVRQTYSAIWDDWFPESGYTPAEAPGFERHNDTFDPRTGNGGVTIWVPVAR